MRLAVTGELERVKAEATKKEKDTQELLSRAAAALKERDSKIELMDNKMKHIEADFAKVKEAAERALNENESMKNEYELALRSREALLAEVAELKGRA